MRSTDHVGRNDGPSAAVIIPFYQRREGLLRRAVTSALAQDGVPSPWVIVVDDASPVSAESDLGGLSSEHRTRITVVEQENAGPGAARNTGLDRLPAGVEYVAFLDSDDEWLPGHLRRAVAALEVGFDLYFSNYRDIGQEAGGFEVRGHVQPDQHDPLQGVPDVYAFRGDLRHAILSACPIETSTVVFRRSAFADLRFRPAFRDSYEDHMFWFEMAAASPRATFSVAIGTQYGTGVNLYRGLAHDAEGRFRAAVSSTKFRAGVRSAFSLTADQREIVDRRLDRDRCAIAGHLMHRLRRRQGIPWSDLRDYLRADPRSLVQLPWAVCRQSFAWLAQRERGAEPGA